LTAILVRIILRIITLTKQAAKPSSAIASREAGEPGKFTISCEDLAAAVRAELVEFFHDGVAPTLGQYAFDHIIGGIIQRLEPHSIE
jgi:hypothetical protein